MTVAYPKKFTLSGLIEVSYNDYLFQIPSLGKTNEYHTSFIQQTYGIGVGGFIYHPRLAVFTAAIKFRDSRQLAGVGGKVNSQVYGGNFLLTFLPYRPVSFDIFGGYNHDTINPVGNFINSQWAVTQNLNDIYYGARLKILKRSWPLIRLEYEHRSSDLFNPGQGYGKIATDEVTLDMRGSLRFLNTIYSGLFRYVDFSSPAVSYKSKEMQVNLRSDITRGVAWQNTFNYSDIDTSKLLSVGSNLNIRRNEIFNQYYAYQFYRSEHHFAGLETQGIAAQDTTQTINSLTGSWTYRFVNGPVSSLSLNYGTEADNNEKAKFYGINFSVSYGRPLLGLSFSPRYRFLLRKDDLRGELLENNLELNLVTKNVSWGTIYSNYSLTVSNEKVKANQATTDEFGDPAVMLKETKIDSIIHLLRAGLRGRAPGKRLSRAVWNIEAVVFLSDSTIKRPLPPSAFDEEVDQTSQTETIKRSVRRYSLLGHLAYPTGWASIFFSTGYSIGESNGRSLRRFFYEERIQYPILRNLTVLARWKQLWENIQDTPSRRVDEYDLTAEYRIGRTTLSAEGSVLRSTTDAFDIYVRRFFLKLRRTI
ncbi:MAG: hypothetical protein WC769_03880 [Thermodesulfovibrionales bacterium]|jgi:hypothetical protein